MGSDGVGQGAPALDPLEEIGEQRADPALGAEIDPELQRTIERHARPHQGGEPAGEDLQVLARQAAGEPRQAQLGPRDRIAEFVQSPDDARLVGCLQLPSTTSPAVVTAL